MSEGFIFLVGPMGAGKSTIGRHLAGILGMPFVDTDQEIEERSGADIPWIFDVEGEDGFRRRESRVLADVCAGTKAVVATGGGIIVAEENRSVLAKHGTTVYLHATLEQQLARTAKDKNRPLLAGGEPAEVLARLIKEREPIYRELAGVVYQTDNRSPKVAAQEIARSLAEIA
ncbi:MAG: shikimate kinase AroK [Gammaproteobacteria bacterium]|nr:shikimate kinase AroK [Gammaproteobacteria bacterium]NND39700.1 shikimate kinase AroK [Pseudomonadales bacterium]MBT8150850.1 shikimate kinase AroK [Gammaproteobacteria bacterium]NNL11087.1 shikimate kinase AroK [Pseudomonadales bacterium]NNM10324.1 shikimate kinase AroK [Pseudomonadales bacterium]